MLKLLTDEFVNEMIAEACKICIKHGLRTRNEVLLKKAGSSDTLTVRNSRIYPSQDAVNDCLIHIKQIRVPEGDAYGNHHDWQDSIVNHFTENKIIIRLTDLPYQFCDFSARQIVPLTRKHVIEGTKLLHVLSLKNGVKGYSCGVPQDTAAPLKTIEQYLIGFRYNRNGGGTIQSVDPDVEDKLFEIRSIAEDIDNPDERRLMLFMPSPLILDSDQLYMCFKPGIKISALMIGSMPMMGMTGPVDPAGVYALALAEAIGAASILHAIFPEAMIYIYPHPQAMDLRTGHMAFGTVEHARLEIIKMQVMKALNLQYYNVKDIMTSAQMPGSMAQGDKALGFYTGFMAGYKAFNLMPLSTDQVWSPLQALLDVQALSDAWESIQPLEDSDSNARADNTINEVLETNCLFAETADTLLNMKLNYQHEFLHHRFQTSEAWQSAGSPEELNAIEQRLAELLSQWDFHPPAEKLEKIASIYYKLCKHYNTEPLKLD